MEHELHEGMQAPEIQLPTDGDTDFELKQCRGDAVIVYFYPKDDTRGCTLEAIDFSARAIELDRLGVRVVGISPDSPARHRKFREKHGLTITLASDEDRSVLQSYGVWAEKTMYGRKYMGVERSTFLVDQHGAIVRIWRNVKVPGHVAEVVAAAEALVGS